MAEFNLHHNVHQLMRLFSLEESGEELTADGIADKFLASLNQNKGSSTSAFLRKLENQSNPEFRQLYDQLKSRNVIELDALINLLARISENNDTKNFIRFHKTMRRKSGAQSQELRPDTGLAVASDSLQTADSGLTSLNSNTIGSQASSETLLNESRTSKVSSRVGGKSSKEKEEKKSRNRTQHFHRSEWNFLSFDYSMIDWSKEAPVTPLSSLSVYQQENALIEDLLHVLIGIEGAYIRIYPLQENAKKNTVRVDDGADKLLKTLTTRITNLCPLYSNVIHFIDEVDTGLVHQALAAAMRGVIKDYFTLIAQQESQHRRGDLTIQKMWYFLQPFFTNMEILKYFSVTIKQANAVGGAVLSILHNKTVSFTGNLKALEFCLQMTRDSCRPYFDIIDKWIAEGIIYDPYNEFFIEDTTANRDEGAIEPTDDCYWENRYKVNVSRMPVFLNRFQEKILNAGKYLSVIRQCGKEISCPLLEPLVYTTEERLYAERIETAYNSASKQLLHLLLEDSDLIGHLNSVKHYFFMDQGDFIVQFMDMAEDELAKDIDDIVPTRLESLLELALRTSSMNSDTHKDEVRIELLNDTVLTQLSRIISYSGFTGSDPLADIDFLQEESRNLLGYESIALTYSVKWPLSLILSRKNIACYQMLFRHLFYCKYVERQLECVWKENKIAKNYALKAVTGYAEAFALRQKMLNFVQNLEYYMMVEVIEPSFHIFLAKVHSKAQVDEISKEHTNFIEGCLRDCMLTQKCALQLMVKLLQLCMSFSAFMQVTHRHSVHYEMQTKACDPRPVINEDIPEEESLSFEEKVKLTHHEFNVTLQQLLREITSQQQEHFSGNILHILNRLDFNEFYSRMRDETENTSSVA